MDAGVCFQMLGGSNTTTKTRSTQSSRTSNRSKESFKTEMDKVFDRNQSTGNGVDKSNTLKKVQQKKDSKRYPENDANSVKNEKNTEDTQEAQVLAGTQIQQPIVKVENILATGDTLQQMQSKEIANGLLETLSEKTELNQTDGFVNVEEAGDCEIKVPFQSSIDLVKSAMLKSAQVGSHENEMQKFADDATKGDLIQGEKVQESQQIQGKEPNLKDLYAENDDATSEQSEPQDQNVLAKTNNLDLAKVNIKVAESPIDTARPDMAKQLADKIMYKLSDGKQEFDLELNPRSLGKVNIKMIFQNGSAELIMSTSNSKAHHLLSMHADALRGILETSTGMDSNVSLKQAETTDGQFDRDNFQEQSNGQQNQHQHQQEKKLTEDISFIDRLRLGLVEDLEEAV